ncbi:hypothetical protein KTS45_15990 [Halomicroarcula limicola]|uniref:Uncharacterized protein n=1 Tax=Haloarcula limicola TaxID=1429915 RepID=A0A8J8C9Q5_9EURY|nr:hypothetical protein [Halomicroarcula limicola]MBV0925705.1 hypothetical protein [Halomicroarcula limicola]
MTARTGLVCGGASVLAALTALFAAGLGLLSTVAGVVGVLLLVCGGALRSGRMVDLAGASLFLEAVVAALQGATTATVLVAGAGTVLAWTFGHAAVDLREDLGTAPSRSVELGHVAGTTALVGGAAALTTLLFRVDVPALSPLALASLVLAGVALTAALRR